MKLFSWIQDLKNPENNSIEEGSDHPISPILQARMHELENVPVREIMTPRPVILALDVDVQLKRVRRLKSAKTVYFPVYKGDLDHVLGWISKQKILELLNDPVEETQWTQFIRPAGIIFEDANAADLADAFLKSASPFLVVKNGQRSTVGIITLSDFVELVFGFDMEIAPTPAPAEFSPPAPRTYEL